MVSCLKDPRLVKLVVVVVLGLGVVMSSLVGNWVGIGFVAAAVVVVVSIVVAECEGGSY